MSSRLSSPDATSSDADGVTALTEPKDQPESTDDTRIGTPQSAERIVVPAGWSPYLAQASAASSAPPDVASTHARRQSGDIPTLVAAEPIIGAIQAEVVEFVTAIRTALMAMAEAAAAVEPVLESFSAATELVSELQTTFHSQYGSALSLHSSETFRVSLESWATWANECLDDMKTRRVHLLDFSRKKRDADKSLDQTQCSNVIQSLRLCQQDELRTAFETFEPQALHVCEAHFTAEKPALDDRWNRTIAIGPGVVGWLGSGVMDPPPIPGVGRLQIFAGSAVLSKLGLQLAVPSEVVDLESETTEWVPTFGFPIPLFLDLDRDGGLVTDSPETVAATLLRLLALLPAGRIKCTLFDPIKLGETGGFLFGLEEAATTIIGEKVKTTERELADALLELEEHITFVTQKYLQSSYTSLTEYDQAAGDVAEPYRVLVLYDYPSGFVRSDGQRDTELISRLGKIVKAGPRCGVFTLVVAQSQDIVSPDGPLASLAPLWTGVPMSDRWLKRLAAGDRVATWPSLDFSLRKSSSILQRIRAANPGEGLVFVRGGTAVWPYRPEEAVPDDVRAAILAHVRRGLNSMGDVRVSATDVSRLAKKRLDQAVGIGARLPEALPDPADPATWWRGKSIGQVSADFGRVGATDIATMTFNSSTFSGALVGGRTGAGKSVLLHAIIASLCMRYPPAELELFLVDFKEGVEFKVYAAGALPHARVVAIESEREFGLSVLESLDVEISRRGTLFRSGAGEEVDITAYREQMEVQLSRIVLVMDEFHVLFDRDDKIAGRAAELLDRIVRQGRAFGVHTILASQTLAGTAALGKHTLNQIPIRIALQSSEVNSRLLLGDGNPDAQLLTRAGEGILNSANGLREANRRFLSTYWSATDRAHLVATLASKVDSGAAPRRPVVFEGREPVELTDLGDDVLTRQESPTSLQLPLGLPLALGDPLTATLRREPGGNLLLVADEAAAYPALTVTMTVLSRVAAQVLICDFGAIDASWATALELLASAKKITVVRSRQAAETISTLAELVTERIRLQDYKSPRVVLIIAGVHRARELDPLDDSSINSQLELLLRDGPDVGVHIIAWCDRLVSLDRRLSSSAQREFGLRLLGAMSKEDSYQLINSDLASQLQPSQMVFDDHDRARTAQLRRFQQPAIEWVTRLAGVSP